MGEKQGYSNVDFFFCYMLYISKLIKDFHCCQNIYIYGPNVYTPNLVEH